MCFAWTLIGLGIGYAIGFADAHRQYLPLCWKFVALLNLYGAAIEKLKPSKPRDDHAA